MPQEGIVRGTLVSIDYLVSPAYEGVVIAHCLFLLQMKLAVPCLVVACAMAVVGSPAISEIRQPSKRPGRFLSLPVPSKCSQSKQLSIPSVWG